MSNKRICYTRPDGGVSVIIPAPEFVKSFSTEAEAIEALKKKDVPIGSQNMYVCDVSDLPDRRFRNTWRQTSSELPQVDLSLARIQVLNELRIDRDKRLAKSDISMLRATETSNAPLIEKLKTYRQNLRDLPQTSASELEALSTPGALSAWKPTWPNDPQ